MTRNVLPIRLLIALDTSARIPNTTSVSKSVDSAMEKVPEKDKISKPFQSEAQRGKFYAMAEQGKISEETVEEWEHATPKGKKLPRKKKMNKALTDAIEILKAVACMPVSGDKLEKDATEKGVSKAAGAPPVGGEERRVSKPVAPKVAPGASPVGGEAKRTPGASSYGSKGTSYNPMNKSAEDEDVDKALKSSAIVGIARRMRLHDYSAGVAGDQPVIGTNRVRNDHEPPVVPVRRVETPEPTKVVVDTFVDCEQCGCVYKSLGKCPKCSKISELGGEAIPFHFRGR